MATEIEITLRLQVDDEALLRRTAKERMSVSGFDAESAARTAATDLAEASYQVILGSNPDVGFLDLGLEMIDYKARVVA